MHTNFKNFMRSVVVLPVLTTSFAMNPVAGIAQSPIAAAISPDQNRTLASEVTDNKRISLDREAAKIDAFFAKYKLPMEGYGKKLVYEADKNGLDPKIIALIALEESTGCKFIIKGTNNCFGWGSGKIRFKSIDEGIETIALAISGNDPETERYYKGKSMEQVLKIYNGHANPEYLSDIAWLRKQIDRMEVPEVQVATANVKAS